MLSPEMMHEGWIYAHPYAHDESRWDDPAFGLWWDLRPDLDWTRDDERPSKRVALHRLGLEHQGRAEFLAAILEIDSKSRLVIRASWKGTAALYELAGCSWMQARAHELWLCNQSHRDIAQVLGCGKASAETHVQRAKEKLDLLTSTLSA